MKWQARWIWRQQQERKPYNQMIVARKSFECAAARSARIAVTADTWYRLRINGEWVADGPCRSWPEHFYYDELDVLPYLRPGRNEIEILALFSGIGDFHCRPQEAGLLAQLEVEPARGRGRLVVATDKTWQVAEALNWRSNTPKVSCQMFPQEIYDARLMDLKFARAAELYPVGKGPWRGLQPRDVALLTRIPVEAQQVVSTTLVKRPAPAFCFPLARLLFPHVTDEANQVVGLCAMAATVVQAPRGGHLTLKRTGLQLATINGQAAWDAPLKRGANLVLVFFAPVGHYPDQTVMLDMPDTAELVNSVDTEQANPWVFVPLAGSDFRDNDMIFPWFPNPRWEELKPQFDAEVKALAETVTTPAQFRRQLGDRAWVRPADEMWTSDPHMEFRSREPRGDAAACIVNADACLHDTAIVTTINPHPDCDIELCLDLGLQDIGYYELDVLAPAGTVLDLFGVEYMDGLENIQHTLSNRNGMRVVCGEGRTQFISTRRRSGRYLFLTVRNHCEPVKLRLVRLIESTYPQATRGGFACSDPALEQIWKIANHTLKLCMEDTFTDCPLYEQTHWVGDARNEGLFAMTSCGAEDLIRRCIRLTGQSVERYPIAGGQTPSSWDMLLPAWSFLWGISVWDYYFYSGDTAFLEEAWPWVEQNLRGAESMLDAQGLFSCEGWNFFDWTEIDDHHRVVLHNNLLLVGMIDANIKCAQALRKDDAVSWLRRWRGQLAKAINRLWNNKLQSLPDSVHADGKPSEKTSVHTSFLALLYSVLPADRRAAALQHALQPPAEMIGVGSPFAMQYLYEALEQAGEHDAILASIAENFLPMLAAGATTVWEQFPHGNQGMGQFPTRSHCHAWSATPILFLNRIVLGIRQTAVAGASYEISPWVTRHTWGKGSSCHAGGGVVAVAWEKSEEGVLSIKAEAPAGVKLKYKTNASHAGLRVVWNGREVQRGA